VTPHPAIAAVLVADALSAIALLAAMGGAVRVAAGWSPAAPGAAQLALERAAEEVSLAGRAALVLSGLATLLLILALNHVLPALIPGAMCGLGVLEAIPGGAVLLALRVAALAGLWTWAVIDKLDRANERGPLAPWSARVLLAAGALALAAALRTATSLLETDLHSPVSCCAAVIDLARAIAPQTALRLAGPWHAVVLAASGAGLAAWALRGLRSRRAAAALLGSTVAWVLLAEWVLLDVFAPYHYGLVGHRCPFCLFLPAQGFAGYVVHGALLVAILEAGALAVATACRSQLPAASHRRTVLAGRILTGALAIHFIASLLPLVVFRWRTGAFL